MTIGALPSGCSHLQKQAKKLRKQLEQAVAAANGGTVTLTQASAINVAVRAELSAQLARKWLIEYQDSLNHADRLSYTKQLTAASEARHKAIVSLNLDHKDPMAELSALFNAPMPASSPTPPAVATQTAVDDLGAVLPTPDAPAGLPAIQ